MCIRSASSPSTVLWAFHTIQPSSYIFCLPFVSNFLVFIIIQLEWPIVCQYAINEVLTHSLDVAGISAAGYPCVGVFTQSCRSNWTHFCHIWLFLLISAAQYLWWTCTDWWFRWMAFILFVFIDIAYHIAITDGRNYLICKDPVFLLLWQMLISLW